MPNQTRQKKMVDSSSITKHGRKSKERVNSSTIKNKAQIGQSVAEKTRQKKMVDSSSITKHGRKSKERVNSSTIKNKAQIGQSVAEKTIIIPEEKVEVLIKEIIRINPRDFSAFKHALEEFVENWDK